MCDTVKLYQSCEENIFILSETLATQLYNFQVIDNVSTYQCHFVYHHIKKLKNPFKSLLLS